MRGTSPDRASRPTTLALSWRSAARRCSSSCWYCLPLFAGRGLVQDLFFVFYMLALAQCWNLLAGYAGLVSVGQQAFVGLGGYLLFALTVLVGLDPLVGDPARRR